MDAWQAGLDALRRDEHVRRRARIGMELSVEERLAEAISLCRAGAAMIEAQPVEVQERIRGHREALAPGAEAAIRRLLVGT